MKTQVLQLNSKKISFWLIFAACFACFIAYVYFINLTIANVVERKSIVYNLSTLSSEISEMEAEYLQLGKDITPELAFSIGFYEASDVDFVSRGGVYADLAQLDL